MLRATSGIDAPLTLHASVSGLAIYLDNFSLIRLAKHDSSRRRRFIAALHNGADLMFSVTNAVELMGPQGDSLNAVRAFLNEVGPHWFPVELNPFEVTERELQGARPDQSCIATDFMKQYFVARTSGHTPGSGRIIDLSEQFFRLGAVLDWLTPQRASILARTSDLDEALIKKINEHRSEYVGDAYWLDRAFPVLPFREDRPATFTYVNLVRTLILRSQIASIEERRRL